LLRDETSDLLVLPPSACYSAVAGNVDEAKKLIEAGFEYVCSHNETMLFRKRK
jgi:hypothetical protein